ncbi:MAG: outer membrane lipoprotein carrier protein LolA [Pirellulales bacterium]|nr:outer membrane lipoprotein carrier protein LolA [Pirellulales bacterium]
MSLLTPRWSLALSLAALMMIAPVRAADPQAQGDPANPVGGGWSTDVAREGDGSSPVPGGSGAVTLSDEQQDFVRRVSDYFNTIQHLQGRFIQINPNNERTRGKFYVRRPGLLRFDYAPPSKLRIVADGRFLSIEDHDLKTIDQYPLEKTPFRLLLTDNVDLLSQAVIIDLSQSDEVASLTLEDKSDGSRGRLQLFFVLPDIELKEWVVTDPQGLDTRIQLADLVSGKELKPEFFQSSVLDFETPTEQ